MSWYLVIAVYMYMMYWYIYTVRIVYSRVHISICFENIPLYMSGNTGIWNTVLKSCIDL